MPVYRYKVRDKEGKEIEGEKEGKDPYEIARLLRNDSLTPIYITQQSQTTEKIKSFGGYLPAFLQRVSLEEKLNFTRNVGVMIGAGVALSKALEVMERQARNPKFKKTIVALGEAIKRGKAFSDALEPYPSVFPKFYREMVRAGEHSGKLEESLKLIALQLKKDYALRKKIRSAMVYPAIIICAMVAIGVLMLIYVVPTLVDTFEELKVPLPPSTRFVIFISQSILEKGFIVLIAVFVLAYLAWLFKRSERGKRLFDVVMTLIPVVRGINQKFNSARTCRTLSSLISAGVDILEALAITKGVVQNHLYQNVLEEAKIKIQKGETISKAFLASEKLYPPLVGEMIAVGEETGELSHMLLRLASFYESEVAASTKDLSTIIEPVLMILIGVVVGFFAISMISPMYNLVGAL